MVTKKIGSEEGLDISHEIKDAWVSRNIKTKRYDVHFTAMDSAFGPLHGSMTFYPLPQGETPDAPTVALTESSAQLLLDELWRQGLRPSNGDDIGAMKAKDAHLKDMRDIAMAFLQTQIDLKK